MFNYISVCVSVMFVRECSCVWVYVFMYYDVCVCVCVCVCVYICIIACVLRCMCVCMYVECTRVYAYVRGVYVCAGMCTCMCVYWYSCEFMFWMRVAVLLTRSCDPSSVTEGLDSFRNYACSEPDTLVIQKPTHGMIRRFMLVRAVKTRRQFKFKAASFHVSVCSCIIFSIYHCQ